MTPLDHQQGAERVDSLYMDLETRLMRNIIRHIKNYDQPIPSDDWLLQKLAEVGKLNKENIQIISQAAGICGKEAEGMLRDMANAVTKELDPGFQHLVRQGVTGVVVPANKSQNIRQVMKGLQKQAKDTLNLCNTTMLYKAKDMYQTLVQNIAAAASEIAEKQAFIQALNEHATAAIVGAESRAQALKKCIRAFNDKGIPAFVDKRGREWTPEAYINMAMRTTSGSVANEIQMARCDDYGIDLIEVDGHTGARAKCAKDQNKIFDRANKSDRYPHWNASSYGDPDGILGINCGHHIYPYVDGVSVRRYFEMSDQEQEESDKLYQKTQKQRALEREIRKQKRECVLYSDLGDNNGFRTASVRLKAKEARLNAFVGHDDQLHRRRDREQVEGFNKHISAMAIGADKKARKE